METLREFSPSLLFGVRFSGGLGEVAELLKGPQAPFLPAPIWPKPVIQKPWVEGKVGEKLVFRYLSWGFEVTRLAVEGMEAGVFWEDCVTKGGYDRWRHLRWAREAPGGTLVLEAVDLKPGLWLEAAGRLGRMSETVGGWLKRHHEEVAGLRAWGVQALGEAEVWEIWEKSFS